MKGLFYSAAAAAAVIHAAGPLSASEGNPAILLEPSSKWHLDMAADKCRLARKFGEGEKQHMLFFEQEQPSASFDLIVAGPSFESFNVRRRLQIGFGDAGLEERERFILGNLEGYGATLIAYGISSSPAEEDEDSETSSDAKPGIPMIDTDTFEGVETLVLSQEKGTPVTLQLKDFQAALKALNGCSQNFITYWGLDLEQHRTMTRRADWTNIAQVAGRIQRTYPRKALLSGEQGTVRMLVIVDENGAVEECRQSDATLLDKLESPACKEMKRAKFDPALDAQGKPMRSYHATKIRYSLPQ